MPGRKLQRTASHHAGYASTAPRATGWGSLALRTCAHAHTDTEHAPHQPRGPAGPACGTRAVPRGAEWRFFLPGPLSSVLPPLSTRGTPTGARKNSGWLGVCGGWGGVGRGEGEGRGGMGMEGGWLRRRVARLDPNPEPNCRGGNVSDQLTRTAAAREFSRWGIATY